VKWHACWKTLSRFIVCFLRTFAWLDYIVMKYLILCLIHVVVRCFICWTCWYMGCYNVKLRTTIEMFPFNLKASSMKVPIPTLYPVEKQHHNSCWPSVGAIECRLVLYFLHFLFWRNIYKNNLFINSIQARNIMVGFTLYSDVLYIDVIIV